MSALISMHLVQAAEQKSAAPFLGMMSTDAMCVRVGVRVGVATAKLHTDTHVHVRSVTSCLNSMSQPNMTPCKPRIRQSFSSTTNLRLEAAPDDCHMGLSLHGFRLRPGSNSEGDGWVGL